METQEKGIPHKGTMTLKNPEEGSGPCKFRRQSVHQSEPPLRVWEPYIQSSVTGFQSIQRIIKESLLLAKYKLRTLKDKQGRHTESSTAVQGSKQESSKIISRAGKQLTEEKGKKAADLESFQLISSSV